MSRKFDSAATETTPNGENIFSAKVRPQLTISVLLTLCLSNHFRVIHDFFTRYWHETRD
jgi:hypothetical protein